MSGGGSPSGPAVPAAVAAIDALVDGGLTVAVAESLTGGLLCARLTEVPGASAAVRGGVVAYATDLKSRLLGVDADLLDREGPVHPGVALAMAAGVADRLGADLGLACTGVAGPDPQGGRGPGAVYVAAVLRPGGPGAGAWVRELALNGGRDRVREGTVQALLGWIPALVRTGAPPVR